MVESVFADRRSTAWLAVGSSVGLLVLMGGITLAVGGGYLPEPVGSLIGLGVAGAVFYVLYLVSGHRRLTSGLASIVPCLLLFVAPVMAADETRSALIVAVVGSLLTAVMILVLATIHRRGGTLRDDGGAGTFYG